MTTSKDIAKNLHFEKIDNAKQPNLIYYTLTGDPKWKEIKVVLNGSEDSQSVKVPSGQWTVLAYDDQIYPEGSSKKIKGGNVSVPGTSAMIIAR